MAINPEPRKMSVEEYFQLDGDSSAKYEYIDGYAVAMSGGSVGHEWIAKNLLQVLDRHLEAGRCRTHTSDMKVPIPTTGSYLLPDVTISCDQQDNQIDAQAVRSPRLIVEVLSPSTEAEDRGPKRQQYQSLPSLQEYVLVSSRYQFVEISRRLTDGTWSAYQEYRPEQLVEFKSLDIHLTFAEIYKNVPVPAKFDRIKELQEKYSVQ